MEYLNIERMWKELLGMGSVARMEPKSGLSVLDDSLRVMGYYRENQLNLSLLPLENI
jgi:hypothetical protein